MIAIDPKHVTIQTAGGIIYANRQRSIIAPLTPEQLARRDREKWNAEVDARKAEKKARAASSRAQRTNNNKERA